VHTPPTSSCGRWFDAAAGLSGIKDLAAFEGQAAVLYEGLAERHGAVAPLPVGHYQQVRLVLAPNTGAEPPFNQSVVTMDGVTHALEVPSGTIKIVHGFSVDTPQPTELTLDFDASQSVKKRGNGTYFMTPVIRATSSTAG